MKIRSDIKINTKTLLERNYTTLISQKSRNKSNQHKKSYEPIIKFLKTFYTSLTINITSITINITQPGAIRMHPKVGTHMLCKGKGAHIRTSYIPEDAFL